MLISIDRDYITDTTRRVQESGATVLHRISAKVSAFRKTATTVQSCVTM